MNRLCFSILYIHSFFQYYQFFLLFSFHTPSILQLHALAPKHRSIRRSGKPFGVDHDALTIRLRSENQDPSGLTVLRCGTARSPWTERPSDRRTGLRVGRAVRHQAHPFAGGAATIKSRRLRVYDRILRLGGGRGFDRVVSASSPSRTKRWRRPPGRCRIRPVARRCGLRAMTSKDRADPTPAPIVRPGRQVRSSDIASVEGDTIRTS